MPAPLNASLSPFFTLAVGDTVRISAQDPTNGTTVAAVIASNASLAVDPGSGAAPGSDVPVFPAFLPA